ncbi:hypothetical protein RI129_003613 [Pyrocoelia pectoralis]|uniref:UBX domain-containing protein 4 n=1 Tax=Pyrocoelia pectoralis TaxID=417401 RepID=A0AAN7VQM7_9COLE
MRWYEGNIAEAVSTSKSKGAVFVVYIQGEDEKSKDFTSLIENEDVSTELESSHFVAIKVEENSVPHQQFTQIYKQSSVPSMFFIGKNGSPLEVVTDLHLKVDFLQKLQQILQRHGVVTTPASLSSNLLEQERNSGAIQESVPVETTDPSTSPTSVDDKMVDNKSEELSSLSSEEKMERAQELINKKRLEKQAEEEAISREKEVERRKMGQDVQKLKRWQQEQELKELMEERNKEKKEQLQARQRVLAQIAQDKAERAARFSNSTAATVQPHLAAQPVARNNNIAKLQFKCSDGSTHTHEFPSNTTLETVRNFIIENLNLPYENFTLSTTFPRREFTVANNNDTLIDLQLVPNAVILILPLQHGTVSSNNEFSFIAMFWSFIAPILNVIGYVKSKLFGGEPGTSANSRGMNRNTASVNESEPSRIQRKKIGESSVIRRHGNVHRLQDNQDSDEDNNTWNGNSTQQM